MIAPNGTDDPAAQVRGAPLPSPNASVVPTSSASELARSVLPLDGEPGSVLDDDQSLGNLLRHRPWLRWLVASLAARLPLAMVPLALVLVGQARAGSITLGATLTGFGSLCACLAAPLRGRLLDRQEIRRALQLDCMIAATVFALLLVVLIFRLPTVALFILSVGSGWSTAGMMSGLRALLVVAVPGNQLRRSHFVESVLTELSYGLGPVLVGAFGLLGGAKLVLVVMLVIQSTAVVSLRKISRFYPQAVTRHRLFRRTDVRALTLLTFCVSLGYGVLESNVPQRMAGFGLSAEAGGWFLGILATGSCIGGVLASIRPTSRNRPRASAAVLSFAFAILIIPEAIVRTPELYGSTLVITTLAFVPLVGLIAAEFEARLGRSQRGEGFAYYVTALTFGGAIGYMANGLLIGPFSADAMPWLSTCIFVLVGTALALSRPVERRRAARRSVATLAAAN